MKAYVRLLAFAPLVPALIGVALSCRSLPKGVHTDAAPKSQAFPKESFDEKIEENVNKLFEEGRKIFRNDTFGSEAFWGDKLKLHTAILGERQGGVGKGLDAKAALKAGLKVDSAAIPKILVEAIKGGSVSLDKPETTLELLKAKAVVGVRGVFDKQDKLVSIGITCALCHSTVDDSFMKGIGRRLDGWPNRDLNVGEIAAMAPNLKPFEDLLQADAATVRQVLKSWGPGKYDAELNQDGKAKGPDGRSGATLIPAAFGLAGQNLHTYSGWGSVPYWNAYVANTQMYGKGTFIDSRLNDPEKYPVAQRSGFYNKRDEKDEITSKLAALHFYQIAIPAPKPPKDSFNEKKAERGSAVFTGKAKCSTCHVPPLFSEPGWAMHTAEEMGIDDFQANRSPDRMYRTTPLAGLFARAKGGFYHDGRFQDLNAVVAHYEKLLKLQLTAEERADLIEYLKSL
jgi:hypothetical protein